MATTFEKEYEIQGALGKHPNYYYWVHGQETNHLFFAAAFEKKHAWQAMLDVYKLALPYRHEVLGYPFEVEDDLKQVEEDMLEASLTPEIVHDENVKQGEFIRLRIDKELYRVLYRGIINGNCLCLYCHLNELFSPELYKYFNEHIHGSLITYAYANCDKISVFFQRNTEEKVLDTSLIHLTYEEFTHIDSMPPEQAAKELIKKHSEAMQNDNNVPHYHVPPIKL